MIRGSALVSGSGLSVMSFRFKGYYKRDGRSKNSRWMCVCVFEQLIYLRLASFQLLVKICVICGYKII